MDMVAGASDMSFEKPEDYFTVWVSNETGNRVSVVVLCGELDATSVPLFHTGIKRLINSRRNIVLDANLLTYIDSTGVSAIISTFNALKAKNRLLCITGAQGLAKKVFNLTQLDKAITLLPDIDTGLEWINSNDASA